MSRGRIFVCDDEPDLREMVGEYFAERDFETVLCHDGKALLEKMEVDSGQLVILDVNMPGMDGISVLREIRARHDVPVIMLTAAAETVDRIIGLELGADDYIGKPVDLRELEARVKTVMRRTSPAAAGAPADERSNAPRVPFGQCWVDMEQARMFDAEGVEVAITAMEYRLIKTFIANKGRILDRDQLLEQAHDRGWEPFDRSIDLRISRLRRKVEVNSKKPEVIRTVRGLGYIFS